MIQSIYLQLMNPITHNLTKLCFSICLDACIVLKILGKNSDDKQANNALKEVIHGKLLPALQFVIHWTCD